MKAKTIIFIDLEGTLLEEKTGKANQQDLQNFIELINKLEHSTETSVSIHLVSPVEYLVMKKVKDYIDRNITEYNIKHKTHIKSIESAACHMDESSILFQTDNTIVPLPQNISSDKKMIGLTEKAEYVKFWHNMLNNRYNIKNLIYIGNGRNDLQAMKYIQSQGGIAICPINSRTKVREIADYISNLPALAGVNEALSTAINSKLQPHQDYYKE